MVHRLQRGRQIAATTIMLWGGETLRNARGWILLEIRHKQYEVNVDEVGADSIRPPWCAKLSIQISITQKSTVRGTVLCAYFVMILT